jgi:hypothetical protein
MAKNLNRERPRRNWDFEEIEVLKSLCSLGYFVPEIAKILKRNPCSIYFKCRTAEIKYSKAKRRKRPTLRELLYGKRDVNS